MLELTIFDSYNDILEFLVGFLRLYARARSGAAVFFVRLY